MPKSTLHSEALLFLLFNNESGEGAGTDNAYTFVGTGLLKSTTAQSLYVALHTANPGAAGSQGTSEVTWSGGTPYARVAVARTTGGWTVTTGASNQVTNAGTITFAQKQDPGSVTVKFWSVGTGATAGATTTPANSILYYGPLALETSRPFTVIDLSDPEDFVCPGHTLAVNDTVYFIAIPGGTLPSGVVEGTAYTVSAIATDTFQLTGVSLSTTGAGRVAKSLDKTITQNDIPEIAAGKIVIIDR